MIEVASKMVNRKAEDLKTIDWYQWACDVNTIAENCTKTCHGYNSDICKIKEEVIVLCVDSDENDFDRAMDILN